MIYKKIPEHVQPYIMHENESAYKAFAKVSISLVYKIILIVNDDEKLIGVVSNGDTLLYNKSKLVIAVSEGLDVTIGEVCTKAFSFLTIDQNKYLHGTRMFVDKAFNEIPIINNEGVPVEIFGRFQAFFQHYIAQNIHLRTHYAKIIGAAGELAKIKGYDRISIIEFGVATGNGLRLAEIYAEELSYLLGIKIDVYGFDSGVGLLTLHDYRDVDNFFTNGMFKTDVDRLKSSLKNAQLIIGDICETAGSFLNENIAPIGAMLIDVDVYRPTVAILDLLLEDDKYFLPEVFLYFDDIVNNWEFQGETLAIKEFNNKSKNAKISPELTTCTSLWALSDSLKRIDSIYFQNRPDTRSYDWGMSRLKVCARFSHPKFRKDTEPVNIPFTG